MDKIQGVQQGTIYGNFFFKALLNSVAQLGLEVTIVMFQLPMCGIAGVSLQT